MSRLPIIIIVAAVLVILGWSSIFVVNEREQAIVLRFGEIVDVKTEPGLYFKLPFPFIEADTVQFLEDRVLRFDLDDIRVQVSGGRFYEVDAFIAYRISDPRRFRQAVSGSVPLAEQRLRTRLDASLRRVYGLRGFEAALSDERSEMMREVRDQLRPDANSLGLEVVDVRIRRTDLTAEVSQQTYERMRAERLAEAELLRARGREAAQRIRARADREVVEITADAQRASEILRGEGDGQRTAIYADAYNRDVDFYDFYRSMTAYTTALDSAGTTMVLSPDSEFFRYFGYANGRMNGTNGLVDPETQSPLASGLQVEDEEDQANDASGAEAVDDGEAEEDQVDDAAADEEAVDQDEAEEAEADEAPADGADQ